MSNPIIRQVLEKVHLPTIPLPVTVDAGYPANQVEKMDTVWADIQNGFFSTQENGEPIFIHILTFVYGRGASDNLPNLSLLEEGGKFLRNKLHPDSY